LTLSTFMCYIIFDAKYMNEIFIKYYITQIKIFKVKIEQEILKKVKLDTYYETEGVHYFRFSFNRNIFPNNWIMTY
jgi:hypothetical protein